MTRFSHSHPAASPHAEFDRRTAVAAGLLGGITISAVLFLTRLAGWKAEVEVALGRLLVSSDETALFVGLAMHLAIAAAVALVYARIFHHASMASAQVGATIGIVHAWLVAAATLAYATVAPGPLPETAWAGFGIDPTHLDGIGLAVFWASHVLYGLVVGVVCSRARRVAPLR